MIPVNRVQDKVAGDTEGVASTAQGFTKGNYDFIIRNNLVLSLVRTDMFVFGC